jgi:uncharacterized protein YunC (DUF1805 family)
MTQLPRLFPVDTVTRLGPEHRDTVLIAGSHAGIYAVALSLMAGARAALHHDGGISRDEAGINGLAWAEAFGFAVAACSHLTCRISDGADVLARGVVSATNGPAQALGVRTGMTAQDAAALLRRATPATSRPAPLPETRVVVEALPGRRRIIAIDSVSLVKPDEDHDQIVAGGSHGGTSSYVYAQKTRAKLILFNDAGVGIDMAGIYAMGALDGDGLAGASVAGATARIGNGRSTLNEGVLSVVNRTAHAMGLRVGMTAREAARLAQLG